MQNTLSTASIICMDRREQLTIAVSTWILAASCNGRNIKNRVSWRIYLEMMN
jgi:hypothetical protein